MNSEIIVALLALAGTLCGSYFAQRRTTALVVYRLELLEKKVDKHNNYAERLPIVEKDIETLKEDIKPLGICPAYRAETTEKIKVINHRLTDLEKGE